MTWTILLIKHDDNGWYVNYIENKLIRQIAKYKLENLIKVIVFQPSVGFSSDYVSVIDEFIDVSDDFVDVVYDVIKTKKNKDIDCVGLKGVVDVDDKKILFNNTVGTDDEACLPITKLNPIKSEIIFNKIKHISVYIGSQVLSSIVNKVESVNKPVVFLQITAKKIPFSIIVTAYNTQDYIEECLDSIEKQTYFINNNNFEVLVGVDGCQNTFNKVNQIKDKYRNLKIHMMSENKGTYITTNTLINLAKNENIIRFDSDDIMTPNLVSEVVKDKKDCDIALLGSLDIINGKIGTNFLITEGIAYFKKSVMDNVLGGYMPWRCAADTELIKRAVNKVKIIQIKKALFYRRIHSESLTQRRDTGYNSDIRNEYKKQIKRCYSDKDIKIERVVSNFFISSTTTTSTTLIFVPNIPISIIITAYKTKDYIEECLDSIEKQTYFIDNDNFEILVGIDNCEETLNKLIEIRHKYRNLRIFMMSENKGTYVTSNTLLSLVKYQNIIRFDSDDIMLLEMIEIISYYIQEYDLIKFGYKDFLSIKENIIDGKFHYPHGVVLYKKTIFERFGGYMNWKCAADTEFLVRIGNKCKIKEINQRLFLRRQHSQSLTKRADTRHGSELRNLYKGLIGKHISDWIDKIVNTYVEY